jgi:hypothetical protein
MQITLNIKDEKEFLAEVKEIVRSQIKQIAREDVTQMYQEEVKRKVESFFADSKNLLEDKLNVQLRKVVNIALDNDHSFWQSSHFVREKATEVIKEILPNIVRKKVDIDEIIKATKNNIFKELEKILDKN